MKAYTYQRYGDPTKVMRLSETPRPEPGEGQVVIRVAAASVNAFDWRLVRAKPFLVRTMGGGFFRPRVDRVGADAAGTVEAAGPGSEFVPGERVFGSFTRSGNGAFAEYALCRTDCLARIPDGVTMEEAAAIPMAALTALQALRDVANLAPGQSVAINGASGGVGTYAVQIARALGARVTAICSTAKVAMVESLGADAVVDYRKTDFSALGERFDVILAVNGFVPIQDYAKALTQDGTYVMAGGSTRQIIQGMLRGKRMSARSSKTFTQVEERPNADDLAYMADLMKEGKVRSVIDRTYPFLETPAALAYVSEGHAAGKVIIKMSA